MKKPSWFNSSNIAGFQTYPNYKVVFRDGAPSRQITASELVWACRELGVNVSSLKNNQKLPHDVAIAAYRNGDITEGRLAESLGVDRLEVRRIEQSTCHHCNVNPIEWADEYCQECWELHCEDEWQRQTVQEIES